MHERSALVIGAGGFIGSHIVESLLQDRYHVRAVFHTCPHMSDKEGLEIAIGDMTLLSDVEKAFEGHPFDEVYQCAAVVGGATFANTGLNDAEIMSNAVLINVNIVKSCIKYRAKKIFFPSSACVYTPDANGKCECREDDAFPANPELGYGWEKLFTERMLYSFKVQYGLNIRIARIHNIIGVWTRQKAEYEKAHTALAKKFAITPNGGTIQVIGDGTQTRTYLHIRDCVRAIRLLMASECSDPINIGSEEVISINEYLDLLSKISEKTIKIEYIPGGPVGIKHRLCDMTRAKELLNWEPNKNVSFEDATKEVYRYVSESSSTTLH